MKLFTRFMLVTIFLLGLSVAAVNAQDATFPADLAGVMVQPAEGGTLVDNGDGTYLLTLEGVGSITSWLFNAPFVNAGRADTLSLSLDWAANPDGLIGSGVLDVEEATILMSLSNPAYDDQAGTLSYTATVDTVFPFVELKDAAPEEFGHVTLFITLNADFISGLDTGYETRSEGTRAPGGRIDLNDPRVIACSQAFPSGGQDYFQCLEDSGVTSTGGGGGGNN